MGILIWIVLGILSLVFYQERAIFLDSAFQVTDLINSENFKIYHNRFSHVLTQFLPLIAIKLKLSLPIILKAYSFNYILLFGGIYWIIVKKLKNDSLGWLLIFFFTLLSLDTFYVVTSELYQGISFLILFFAILIKHPKQEPIVVTIILMILLFFIVFAHSLTAPFFLLFWSFFLLHDKQLWNWKYVALLFVCFLIIGLHSEYFTNWYNIAKQKTFWNNFNTYFPNFHTLPANKIFLKNTLKYYYFFPILLAVVTFGYSYAFFSKVGIFRKSKKVKNITFPLLKLILILGFCFCYLLINHISDPEYSYRFYSEVNYLGLSIPVCLALIFDFFPLIKNKKILLSGIAITMCIRLVTIANGHQKFENRINWYSEQLEANAETKTILNPKDCPKEIYIQEWASAEETLLISTLKNLNQPKTIFISSKKVEDLNISNREFLNANKKVLIHEMNNDYFKLDDTFYQVK